jgi:hypothetical protein
LSGRTVSASRLERVGLSQSVNGRPARYVENARHHDFAVSHLKLDLIQSFRMSIPAYRTTICKFDRWNNDFPITSRLEQSASGSVDPIVFFTDRMKLHQRAEFRIFVPLFFRLKQNLCDFLF